MSQLPAQQPQGFTKPQAIAVIREHYGADHHRMWEDFCIIRDRWDGDWRNEADLVKRIERASVSILAQWLYVVQREPKSVTPAEALRR